MKYLMLVAVLLLVSTQVCAATVKTFETGNTLLSQCKELMGRHGYSFCGGYIVSAIDITRTWQSWGDLPGEEGACVPDGVTQSQLRRVVVKYLEDNPTELHLNAGASVLNALRIAFPCP